jgi:hypothetical protein
LEVLIPNGLLIKKKQPNNTGFILRYGRGRTETNELKKIYFMLYPDVEIRHQNKPRCFLSLD